jgi:Domain of unknown function (DUF4893)
MAAMMNRFSRRNWAAALALGLGMAAWGMAGPGGYPLHKVMLFQDGEDVEQGHLDYVGGTDDITVAFPVPKGEEAAAKKGWVKTIQFWLGEEEEQKPVLERVAPGQGWKVQDVWEVPGQPCLLVAASVEGKMEWHAFKTRSPAHLGSVAEGDVVVEAGRARFAKPVPDKWAPYFPAAAELKDNETWWGDLIHDQHLDGVKNWRSMLSSNVEDIRGGLGRGEDLADARAELPFLDSVLAAKPAPIKGSDLAGDWKVRSVQHGTGGAVFAYPWFKCRISEAERGELKFEKTNGSQRRSGKLYRHNGTSWVFLGGATVNDDPQVGYQGKAAKGEPADSDSSGVLVGIGQGRYAMVMDFGGPRGWEIYELKKP